MGKGGGRRSKVDDRIAEQRRQQEFYEAQKLIKQIQRGEHILPANYESFYRDLISQYLDNSRDRYDAGFFVPLSGGVDSSTTLAFAVRYADMVGWEREKVNAAFCIRKNPYPAEERDFEFAKKLSKELGNKLHVLDVTPILEGLDKTISPSEIPILEDERICRARSLALRTLEDFMHLPSLATGNYSEALLGQYTTGAYSGQIDLIGPLFKTEVYELAKRVGVPAEIIGREKVSSELREGALFTDYNRIDPILFKHLIEKSLDGIVSELGEDMDFVTKIVDRVNDHENRTYDFYPTVTSSGEHVNAVLGEYAYRVNHDSLVGEIHRLRMMRWG